jgi:hypothetical protein
MWLAYFFNKITIFILFEFIIISSNKLFQGQNELIIFKHIIDLIYKIQIIYFAL